MQNLEELLRKAEEIRQEVRIGGNTAQRVGLVLVQLVDAAQALLAQIQEEERLRQETDASIKKDINTLDEKVEDLPSPVAPLANNNGLLELKYDTESLYVQDGKLCARLPEADPSEPVPGAGIIYSEGAGISIDDENVISVRIGKSLELDNNGAIRVGTGEGLIHNKEGRLCVNLGDGLGIDEYSNKIILKDNDYIKSLPSLFEKKQDVIEPGNGLEKVGNLLKVEDTLVSDVIKSKQHISSLQVEINQQSIQISSKQDKLSEGLGIIISDKNEISVNGNVLSVKHAENASNDASGRSISGTYATQEEVGSVARSLAGVETKVDANAAAIEELRNNEDIIFGDGLSHVGNVVEVDSNIISGITDNAREIEGILTDVNDLQSSVSDIDTIRANANNGNEAYDWGNHGTAGYAKTVKVGDKRYEADPSATISLPAYPTSLPANGGNADTLDGHDSSYFATKSELGNKQDKLTQGSGIEITSENVINVDGSTMHVQLSTNAINDEDGNRIRATYAKKEEVDGIYGAIEATNTTVASHTTRIENLTNNKQDKLEFGNGLSTVGNLVKVEDAVLKNIADNKKNIDTLSSSISGKQDKLTPSDGINLNEGKLSVRIGTGLEFDPLSSAVVVKVGAGVTTDINQSLAIKHDATLTTDADGQLGVNQGTITNIAASEVAKVVANAPANYDTLKEIADYIATDTEGAAQLSNRIGAVESALPNKQDTISDLSTIRSNAANGATAYGWGYHGTAGYAKKAKVNGSTYEADSNGVINLPAYPTSLPASDVYAWAKASSKPSYSWSEINNKPDVATKEDLNNKQDTLTFGSGLTNTNGIVTVDYKTASVKWSNISDKPTFATVATSGSYNDLSNKPTIPSAVTESTVSGWGFTKNTGTYSKPSGGIPKSDLASSVQTTLGNADTAYGWGYHGIAGYAKKVKVGGTTYEADADAVVTLPAYPTSLPANGGNADTLGGYLPRNVDIFFTQAREKELDLTALDSNYYYPCAIHLSTGSLAKIRIWCTLGDRPVPSWATHSNGFVLNLEWEAVGCGWGTTSVNRKITTYHYWYSDKSPCGNISQNTLASEEIVFLRGGAKYFYHTSNDKYFVVHPNGYSWSAGDYSHNDPIRPLSEAVDIWSCSQESALGVGSVITNYVYGTAEKADKLSTPRKIWGRNFDGSEDVSGDLKDVVSIVATNSSWRIAKSGNEVYLQAKDVNGGNHGNIVLSGHTAEQADKIMLLAYNTTISGNVGIGTTDPQYKLDVNGSLNATDGYINGNSILHTGNIGDGFENVGGTIKISTAYITEKIKGDGLVLGENGKLNVDSANLSVKSAALLTPNSGVTVRKSDWNPNTDWIKAHAEAFNYKSFNADTGDIVYYLRPAPGSPKTAQELCVCIDGDYYANTGTSLVLHTGNYATILDSAYLSKSGGTLTGGNNILTLQSTGASAFIAFDYGTTRKATVGSYNGIAYIANETNSKCPRIGVNDAGKPQYWDSFTGDNKYDLLHSGNIGNGLQYANNVVQLKLSTGLAIDDRGYLYVTGL